MGRRRTSLRYRRRGLAALLMVLMALAVAMVALAGKDAASRQHPSRASTHAAVGSRRATPSAPAGTRSAQTLYESLQTPQVRKLIALGKPIYCGGHRGNEVALTFDDGPGQYTRLADAKLGKHHIKATFFIVGRNIALMPDAVRTERGLGAVGDHTYTHPLLTSLSPGQAEAEIVRTQAAVERASGGPVFLFRPPYGGRNAMIDSIARAHGLLEIMWTVDSADSLGASYAQIERNVIGGMRPGAIILMHENHGQTIRAMLNIFAGLKRKHLRPVSVAKLLTDDPPSEAQVRAGGMGCGATAPATRSAG